MKLDEFWLVAPVESREFLDERTKGELEMAWRFGLMHHIDPKKYPKRAELLWDPNAGDQSVEQMIMLAKAWASASKKDVQQKKT